MNLTKTVVVLMALSAICTNAGLAGSQINNDVSEDFPFWRGMLADIDDIYSSQIVSAIRGEFMPTYLKYSALANTQRDWKQRKMFRDAANIKLKKAVQKLDIAYENAQGIDKHDCMLAMAELSNKAGEYTTSVRWVQETLNSDASDKHKAYACNYAISSCSRMRDVSSAQRYIGLLYDDFKDAAPEISGGDTSGQGLFYYETYMRTIAYHSSLAESFDDLALQYPKAAKRYNTLREEHKQDARNAFTRMLDPLILESLSN